MSKDKVFSFINQHIGTFCLYGNVAGIMAMMFGSAWWLLIPGAMLVLEAYLIRFVFRPLSRRAADDKYWYPSNVQIDSCMDELFEWQKNNGYCRTDYKPQVHDCDDYALAQACKLHELFLKRYPQSVGAYPVFQFSFRRDDGKRHRLVCVVDNDKRQTFIENWPVHDVKHDSTGRYRHLSISEKANGYIVG